MTRVFWEHKFLFLKFQRSEWSYTQKGFVKWYIAVFNCMLGGGEEGEGLQTPVF